MAGARCVPSDQHPSARERTSALAGESLRITSWTGSPQRRPGYRTPRNGTQPSSQTSYAHLRGNLVSDAQLAALAIEHGLTVCSADSDFARFAEIRWENRRKASANAERARRQRRCAAFEASPF